ncbi:hypothetical protein GCM10023320_61480 [Pseudonocardia adelaidensis]|uniref:Uncharacterized protein n=1 Tax=Pseudonocardia adelaidensis TaxID=648754 RepID=A0ABP9NU24_9PSEU
MVEVRPEPRREGRLPPVPLDQLLGPLTGAVDGPVDDRPDGSPAAARPHVSQYPPSIVPPQAGRSQGCGPVAAAEDGCGVGGAAASPQVSQ